MPTAQDAPLTIELWPVDRPQPYEQNPRIHTDASVAKIAASLEHFGWRQPIVVDGSGVVILGHGRLLAAKHLDMLEVPVHVAKGLSAAQVKALRLADNRTQQESTWEYAALNDELRALADLDFDLAITGFDPDELAGLWGVEQEVTQDDAPSAPAEPRSKLGDLYILGNHRLLCGDATNASHVGRLLAGAVPGIMVTDPPYGVEYGPSWRHDVGLDDSERMGEVANDDRADWTPAWELFPGDVAYVWHSGLRTAAVEHGLEVAGFICRSQIIWVKQSIVIGRGHYHWRHEPASYAVREGRDDAWDEAPERATPASMRYLDGHEGALYAVREGETAGWVGGRKESTVWEIENVRDAGQDQATVHGTQKPIECMARPMRNHALAEVYDPFCGSGTSVVAAEQLGRACYAMELDPAYVDVIVDRWEALTGRQAELQG